MKVVLLGKPIAKMRARYAKRGDLVITYDPQEDAKNSVKLRFQEALQKALDSEIKTESMDASSIVLAKAYEVHFYFYLPLNESDSKPVRNSKLWGFELPACKPDYDNLEKFYLDCANGILWRDDCMIIDGHAHKRYDETPRMEVVIMAKKELSMPEKAEKIIKTFSPSELKEFLYDVRRVGSLEMDMPDLEETKGDTLAKWLTTAASVLSEFSIKYASLLKKIEKAGDLKKDLHDLEEGKQELEEGRFLIGKALC